MPDSFKKKLKLKVSAINNGTVIDHIPSENLFKILSGPSLLIFDFAIFVSREPYPREIMFNFCFSVISIKSI